MSEATRLIGALGQGDSQAASALLPLIYDELRRLARSHMARERSDHTLQATALVHEACLRLVDGQALNQHWDGRRHFFASAAEAMRRILVEHARRKQSLKRGGGQARVEFPDDGADLLDIATPCADFDELLALDAALKQLGTEHPQKAELIKLLYFAGLNLEEAGAAMGFSTATAHRHAIFARAWLHKAMKTRAE